MSEHEYGGGRQDSLPGAACKPSEHHDVVHAGRQKDEQESCQKGGRVADRAGQGRHHQWRQDEVDDQERHHEACVGDGGAQTRQRNSEEGCVQQCDQNRVDGGF